MKRIIISSYLFSLTALGMFVYTTFFSNEPSLRGQGIYWFGISLACLLLPEVRKLKLKDVEVEFKEKLKKVERKIFELEDEFFKHLQTLRKEEDSLPADYIERRNRHWDNFEEYVQSLDEDTRFEIQKSNTLHYLQEFKLSVKQLKERLSRLGYYTGVMDDVFSKDLAEALTAFQRVNNLRHVDGVFGQLTYEAMAERLRDTASKQD
jgi:hypothetical protein